MSNLMIVKFYANENNEKRQYMKHTIFYYMQEGYGMKLMKNANNLTLYKTKLLFLFLVY